MAPRSVNVGRIIFQRVFFLFLITGMCSQTLFCQAVDAQITGVVKDPSGAVIPGAALVATNIEKNTTFSTTSNGEGIYRFPSLPPARTGSPARLPVLNTLNKGR